MSAPPNRRCSASFESLRNTDENTLFNAASSYMDVIRDRQIAVLTEQNLQFLTEQARAARSRFEVGEGTRTDVAQADASRAVAVAQLSAAQAQAISSAATYRQIVGDEPGKLKPAAPVAKLLPASLDAAILIAANEHPAILATQHLVDAAAFSVKSTEGALLPQISASAGVSQDYRNSSPAVFRRRQRHFDLGQHRRDADSADLYGRPNLCDRTPVEGIAQPGPDRGRCQP